MLPGSTLPPLLKSLKSRCVAAASSAGEAAVKLLQAGGLNPFENRAPRKGFLRLFLDAMMEARMHQAQREIRLYTRLVSPVELVDDDKTKGGI